MGLFRGVVTGIVAACTITLSATGPVRAAETDIKVVMTPITNYVSLLIAKEKGFFADENLNVTWSSVAQAAVGVEAVYGGSVQFAGGSVLEPMIARGNRLDLILAVPVAKAAMTPPDNSALVVRADSDIKSAADFSGKKVSAGLVNGINYVHLVEWLKDRNSDPSKVEFLEIPFTQMGDALLNNRLDVIWAVEPFLTVLRKSGKVKVLAYPFSDNIPGMDLTAFFAKESWIKANPKAALGFRKAILKATEYLQSLSKEERDGWVSKFTGIKPELVAEMYLPNFSTTFDETSLRKNLEMAVKQKLSKPFDVKEMIWNPQ
jgi:NitT/TauT family transport system substrate-binding protein